MNHTGIYTINTSGYTELFIKHNLRPAKLGKWSFMPPRRSKAQSTREALTSLGLPRGFLMERMDAVTEDAREKLREAELRAQGRWKGDTDREKAEARQREMEQYASGVDIDKVIAERKRKRGTKRADDTVPQVGDPIVNLSEVYIDQDWVYIAAKENPIVHGRRQMADGQTLYFRSHTEAAVRARSSTTRHAFSLTRPTKQQTGACQL